MSVLQDFDQRPEEVTPRRHSLRRVVIGLLACFTVLAMIPVGAYFYFEHRLSENVTRLPNVFAGLEHRPPKPVEKAVNILIVGTDRRSEVPTTGSDAEASDWVPGAQRSDTLMILHIDADREAATITSIPRDTWVNVPGYGMNKINAAFSFGGPTLAVQTVEDFTNVYIDHLAVVDWTGFAALIDEVGGVDVTVPAEVTDSARDITWTAGDHHLDGDSALLYVRQRYGLSLGDIDRVARQQAVLRSLVRDVLSRDVLGNPKATWNLVNTATQHFSVDDEWSVRDMAGLAVSLRDLRNSDLTYITMPVAGFGREGEQSVVYADQRVAATLWEAIAEDAVARWADVHKQLLTPQTVS